MGRKNDQHFQVVVAPHTNPIKGSFTTKLGWYNPKTKEFKVNKEAVLEWINKGAKPSNTVAKLLIAQGIKHKNIVYIPDAPAKPRKKDAGKKESVVKAPKNEESAPEVTDDKISQNVTEKTSSQESEVPPVDKKTPTETLSDS